MNDEVTVRDFIKAARAKLDADIRNALDGRVAVSIFTGGSRHNAAVFSIPGDLVSAVGAFCQYLCGGAPVVASATPLARSKPEDN